MALHLNTNVPALHLQRHFGQTHEALTVAMARLSSSWRINSAKDDAAGLAIAQRMSAQIDGMQQAQRNANDGISLSQTAEGAIGSITDMLQRGRELAVQAANGTYSDADRQALQSEWRQLADEVERVANTTSFNGQKLLDGSFAGALYQVGPNSGDMVAVGELANMTATQLGQSGNAPQGLRSVDLGTAAGAQQALQVFDAAIDQVSSQRASLGAVQNRFASSVQHLQTMHDNLSASRSRLADADYAREISHQSRNQILLQIQMAMQSQANQRPQGVLALLGR